MQQDDREKRPFSGHITFSLSPAEFLAFVWVYRNEIHPIFSENENATAAVPSDLKNFYHEIRHGILNGDLRENILKPEEIKFFQEQSENLFAPFRNSHDKIEKPDDALIKYARDIMTDLITECGKAQLIGLDSSLVNGNITFTITPSYAATLKRPY